MPQYLQFAEQNLYGSIESVSSNDSITSLNFLKSLSNNHTFWDALRQFAQPMKKLDRLRQNRLAVSGTAVQSRGQTKGGRSKNDWKRWKSDPIPDSLLERQSLRGLPVNLVPNVELPPPVPIPAPAPTLAPAILPNDDFILKLLSDILRERTRLVEIRAGITTRQNEIVSQLPLDKAAFRELQTLLDRVMPDLLESNISVTTRDLLRDKWPKFASLARTIDNWQTRVEQETNNLFELEARLLSKEQELYKHLSCMNPGSVIEHSRTLVESHAASTESSNLPASSASTEDEDEDNYYEAIGQINLLRDRLFNLESSFLQDRLRHGSGEKSVTPDILKDTLYEEYMVARQTIIEQYFEAKKLMEHSQRRCEEKKIDIEPPNLPPSIDLIFTAESTVFHEIEQVSHVPHAGDESRVEHWLKDVLHSSPGIEIDIAEVRQQPASPGPDAGKFENEEDPLGEGNGNPSFQGGTIDDGDRWSEPGMRTLHLGQLGAALS